MGWARDKSLVVDYFVCFWGQELGLAIQSTVAWRGSVIRIVLTLELGSVELMGLLRL